MERKFKIPVVVLLCLFISVQAAPSRWAVSTVNLAIESGLSTDKVTADFQKDITREEFAELAVRLYCRMTGADINTLTQADVNFSDTTNPDIYKAVALDIVKGMEDGTFAPDDGITREQLCTMLARAAKAAYSDEDIETELPNTFEDESDISPYARAAVKYNNMRGVILGKTKNTINPQDPATCEQALMMVFRLASSLMTERLPHPEHSFFPPDSRIAQSNLANKGFAVRLDRNAYLALNNGIFVDSAGQLKKICDANAEYLNVTATNIYYRNKDDGGIYNVAIAGGQPVRVGTQSVTALFVEGNKLRYLSQDDNAPYELDLKTEETRKLGDPSIGYSYFDRAGNFYYLSDGEASIQNSDGVTSLGFRAGVFHSLSGKYYYSNTDAEYLLYSDGVKLSENPVTAFSGEIELPWIVYASPNGVYKLSYDGTKEIRISASTDVIGVITAFDYVLLKHENGDITKIMVESGKTAAVYQGEQ